MNPNSGRESEIDNKKIINGKIIEKFHNKLYDSMYEIKKINCQC